MGFQQGPCDTIEGCTMAMPQRDETSEDIKRLEPPSPRLRRVKRVA